MTKLHWAGVAVAIGVGIIAQIPDHDSMAMDGQDGAMPAMEGVATGHEMVTLAVTGMT